MAIQYFSNFVDEDIVENHLGDAECVNLYVAAILFEFSEEVGMNWPRVGNIGKSRLFNLFWRCQGTAFKIHEFTFRVFE
ncbi:hypothetical protein PMAYCL1PPCAC_19316, partial [Pristionchus mayeri]